MFVKTLRTFKSCPEWEKDLKIGESEGVNQTTGEQLCGMHG